MLKLSFSKYFSYIILCDAVKLAVVRAAAIYVMTGCEVSLILCATSDKLIKVI